MSKGKLCSQCSRRAIGYVDRCVSLDRQLGMLANLCAAATDPEPIDPEAIRELGDWLTRYLRKRRQLGHRFFGSLVPLHWTDGD